SIAQHKEGVLDKAYELKEKLSGHFRVDIDASDKMPGWKFNEYEMKGVPIRLEVGPKDLEKNQVVLVRRDTGEIQFIPVDGLVETLENVLIDIQKQLFYKAKQRLQEKTYAAVTMEQFEEMLHQEG